MVSLLYSSRCCCLVNNECACAACLPRVYVTSMLGHRLGSYANTACPDTSDDLNIKLICAIFRYGLPWIPVAAAGLKDLNRIRMDWGPRSTTVRVQVVARTVLLYVTIAVMLDAWISEGCINGMIPVESGKCYADTRVAKIMFFILGVMMMGIVLPYWGQHISKMNKKHERVQPRAQQHGGSTKNLYISSVKEMLKMVNDGEVPSGARSSVPLRLNQQLPEP